MKIFFYIATVIWFAISLTSCGSSMAIQNDSKEKEVVYTLKSKMELMEQKIYNKNSKTIIAIP
jgi:hypothetical protein